MRYAFILILLICTLLSCNSKPSTKKYYIVVEREIETFITGHTDREIKIDSIMVENDSLAYMQGIFTYAANLKVGRYLHREGKAALKAKDFDVLNEQKRSILYKISDSQKSWGQKLIDENK